MTDPEKVGSRTAPKGIVVLLGVAQADVKVPSMSAAPLVTECPAHRSVVGIMNVLLLLVTVGGTAYFLSATGPHDARLPPATANASAASCSLNLSNWVVFSANQASNEAPITTPTGVVGGTLPDYLLHTFGSSSPVYTWVVEQELAPFLNGAVPRGQASSDALLAGASKRECAILKSQGMSIGNIPGPPESAAPAPYAFCGSSSCVTTPTRSNRGALASCALNLANWVIFALDNPSTNELRITFGGDSLIVYWVANGTLDRFTNQANEDGQSSADVFLAGSARRECVVLEAQGVRVGRIPGPPKSARDPAPVYVQRLSVADVSLTGAPGTPWQTAPSSFLDGFAQSVGDANFPSGSEAFLSYDPNASHWAWYSITVPKERRLPVIVTRDEEYGLGVNSQSGWTVFPAMAGSKGFCSPQIPASVLTDFNVACPSASTSPPPSVSGTPGSSSVAKASQSAPASLITALNGYLSAHGGPTLPTGTTFSISQDSKQPNWYLMNIGLPASASNGVVYKGALALVGSGGLAEKTSAGWSVAPDGDNPSWCEPGGPSVPTSVLSDFNLGSC